MHHSHVLAGTYYIVPFTCSRQFKVNTDKKSTKSHVSTPLFVNGALSPDCMVVVKELHARFDADLDGVLSIEEATPMFSLVLDQQLVRRLV